MTVEALATVGAAFSPVAFFPADDARVLRRTVTRNVTGLMTE